MNDDKIPGPLSEQIMEILQRLQAKASEPPVARPEPCAWCASPAERAGFCSPCYVVYADGERRRLEQEALLHGTEWLDSIGVPRGLQTYSFSTVKPTPAVKVMMEFRAHIHAGRAIVVLGPTGVGKTVSEVALIASLLPVLQAGQRFENGLGLVRELNDFSTADAAVRRCLGRRLLVLDDLPALREPRVVEAIDEILIAREHARMPTVISSNIPPEALNSIFTDRVRDRLRTWGRVVQIAGPSLRQP